jgi:hypothetical protein
MRHGWAASREALESRALGSAGFVFVVNLLTTSLWGSVSGWPSGSDPEAKLPDAPAEVNGLLNRYPERSAYPNAMPR